MNVLDRLNTQIKNAQVVRAISIPTQDIPKKVLSKPLSSDRLRALLMQNSESPIEQPVILTEEKVDLVFDGIESFVAWYQPLVGNFTNNQNIAMSTLVSMRDMINNGCACKKNKRANAANDYYVTFWTENGKTDLPQKIMEVGNGRSLVFKTKDGIIYDSSKVG